MPRQSLESLSTAPVIDVWRARLLPGPELSPKEVGVFTEITLSVVAGHFRETDRMMVTLLAQNEVIRREVAAELAEQGLLVDGKPNPLIRVMREQTRLVASLATKCRLTTQARISAGKAAAAPQDPVAMVDFRRLGRE